MSEITTCLHHEKVEASPLPDVEIGKCIQCGQTIQYDRRASKAVVSVTLLGRIDGKIVLPDPHLKLLLSGEETRELKVAQAAAPTPATYPAAPAERKVPELRKATLAKFSAQKEEMLHDYYAMLRGEFFRKWGLTSTTWLKLKRVWQVKPKGMPQSRHQEVLPAAATRKEQPELVSAPRDTRAAILPPFPDFQSSWSEIVQLRWLETYRAILALVGK